MPESTAAQATETYRMVLKNSHNYNRWDFYMGQFQSHLENAERHAQGRMPLRKEKGHSQAHVYRFKDKSLLVIPITKREKAAPYVPRSQAQLKAADKVLRKSGKAHPTGRDVAQAIAATAVALDAVSPATGHTPTEILDIACRPFRNRQVEFTRETSPDHPFGQLLKEALAPGSAYDAEKDSDGEWWHDNVVLPFGRTYLFW